MKRRPNIFIYVSHKEIHTLHSEATIIIINTLKNYIRHLSICMLRLCNFYVVRFQVLYSVDFLFVCLFLFFFL